MAEKSVSQEWVDPEAWLNELSDELSEDCLVVAEPEIQHVSLSGIIVAPKGIIVMHARDWSGRIIPSSVGSWRQKTSSSGKAQAFPNPSKSVRSADKALKRFLKDEFPKLKLNIVQLVVLTNPKASIVGGGPVNLAPVVRRKQLAQVVSEQIAAMKGKKLKYDVREELAIALAERKLTRTQHATSPFVFRSGGLLGGNRKAWTLKQLFNHIDKNPTDGIYHMRNGTLEQWLKTQGALHMVKLVREAVDSIGKDPRAALEKMLAKTGLVNPRGIVVQPRKLNLGRILAGADYGELITVKSGARYGYVVGDLTTSETWLRVEPKQISGRTTQVAVRVDTAKLPILGKPYNAEIVVNSELAEKPITLPVQVRVVSEPSGFVRFILRPLLSGIFAALAGIIIGASLGIFGIAPPAIFSNLLPSLTPLHIWAALIGLFWLIWGVVRGFQQPLTQPIDFWMFRWFLGVILWMIPIGVIALAVTLVLNMIPSISGSITPEVGNTILIGALAASIVPAVLDKGKITTGTRVRSVDTLESKRPVVVTLIAVALAALIISGMLYIPNLWRSDQVQSGKATAQSWVTVQYQALRVTINKWVEDYYLQRYDRRAKGNTIATVTPAPTRTVPAE